MKRSFWITILFATLLSPMMALAQSATTDTTTTTDTSVKQVLKTEMVSMFSMGIHLLFQELRPLFGLPATPTDPTTDPLFMLETAIISSLTAATSQASG